MAGEADSSLTNLAYVKETTFGVFPSGPPTLQNIRYTSESLKKNTGTVQSQEIRSDRQITKILRNSVSAQGAINHEWSATSFDDFIEAALLADATWSAVVSVISADTNVEVITSNTFNLTTGSWTNTPAAGDVVRVTGFSGTGQNGFYKVSSATSSTIVIPGTQLTNVAAGDSVTITVPARVQNGTTLTSFSIEKEHTDVANEFVQYTGMAPNTWNEEITIGNIVNGAFNFLGKDGISATATGGTGTNTGVTTTQQFNAIDNITQCVLNDISVGLTQFSFSLNNNLGIREEIKTLGAIGLRKGTINLTGTLRKYFRAKTEMDYYRNFTNSSILIALADATPAGYVLDIPGVKFTDGQQVAGGQNQDVLADLTWATETDSVTNKMFRVYRY